MPYLLEAVELLDEGIPATAIDRAAVAFGMPMGPIELADTVGLDICLSVADKMAGRCTIRYRISCALVDQGHLGRKSSQGFYAWKDGKAVKPAPAGEPPRRTGHQRSPDPASDQRSPVACLREGVVGDEDLLDAGVIFGTGFAPFGAAQCTMYTSRGSAKGETATR